MQVRIVKDEGTETTYECRHVTTTLVDAESKVIKARGKPVAAIVLELGQPRGESPIVLRLPDDGEVAYLMNNDGDTTKRIPWPPKGHQVAQPEAVAEEVES